MASSAERLTTALADRYRLERELGQGGMATVYLAQDVRHDRRVALKVLRPELAAVIGPSRFLAEIKTTANLQHPHILPLHDSGEVDGTVFYVMPYVEGESLRDRLTREKQLPVEDAIRITREVAAALDYAHRHGVIHRDIKPENILLHDGTALVADFGIALAVSSAGGGSRMTETGMSLGTPHYMSPEQAMGERGLSPRSDVYALGCVLYEMLAGEPPFTGPTAQSIVAKVMTDEPRPLTELRRTVPAPVESAVLTALEKLPADRFGSAAEFAAALDTSRAAPRRTGGRSGTRPGPAWPDRRFLVPVLLGTTLGAIAWGAWEAFRSRPSPSNPVARFTVTVPFNGAPSGSVLALSPDGTRLAVVTRPAGRARWGITLRRLDQLEQTELAGIPEPVSPFFSPDGAWLAFASGNRLYKVPIEGGTSATLAELGPAQVITDGTWSRSGEIVLADQGARLWRVSPDGTPPVRIGRDSARFAAPNWLPDGKHLVAVQLSPDGSSRKMVAITASDGRVIAELGTGYSPHFAAGHLVWLSPEGRILTAPFDLRRYRLLGPPAPLAEGLSAQARSTNWTVSENGTVAYSAGSWNDKELVLVSATGASITLLPLGRQAFRGPRFSPDGRKIAVDVEPGGDLIGDVWVYDRGAGTFSRVTFEGSSVFPEWTPDGKALIYSTATGAAARELRLVPADRSAPPTTLVQDPSPVFEGVMAPDGKTLLYRVNNPTTTSRDIFLRGPDGRVEPFATTPFAERAATISRDGLLVLYVSNESGREEVYLQPLRGRERAQVSVAGGIEPRWGPEGRTVLYRWGDTLFAAPLLGAMEVGPRRVVLTGPFATEAYHANYDVAPDGGFVFVRPARTDAPGEVTLILNGFASRPGSPR
jgi:serine/threonine-protein kinase